MKKATLLIFLILFNLVLKAQFNNIDFNPKLPRILHPSPAMEFMNKMANVSINHTSGMVDVNFLLHTLQIGDISVPIVLQYNYNGFKPSEANFSNVGLGWQIIVGGNINRIINDKADDLVQKASWTNQDFLSKNELNSDDFIDLYWYDNNYDKEYDIFNFHLPHYSGKFILNDNGNSTFSVKKLVTTGVDIQCSTTVPTHNNHYSKIDGFTITDDYGNIYNLGYNNKGVVTDAIGPQIDQYSEYYLNYIQSVDKTKKVTFTYETMPELWSNASKFKRTVIEVNDRYEYNCTIGQPPIDLWTWNHKTLGESSEIAYGGCRYKEMKMIKKITSDIETIEFILNSDKKYIRKILIKNKTNNIIKTIEFDNDQNFSSYKRPKLLAYNIKDKNGNTSEKYEFNYETLVNFDENSYVEDYWGYYRGQTNRIGIYYDDATLKYQNLSSQGNHQSMTMNVDGLDMESKYQYTKAFILKSILYPTGGRTNFIYELNQYQNSYSSVKNGGGLRIKKIQKLQNGDVVTEKEFEYKPAYSLTSLSWGMPCLNTYIIQNINASFSCNGYNVIRKRLYFDRWNSVFSNNDLRYKKVTEYNGTINDNSGKIVYEYEGTSGDYVDRINYQYIHNDYNDRSNEIIKTKYLNKKFRLATKSIYANQLGQYKMIKKVDYDYCAYHLDVKEKMTYKLGAIVINGQEITNNSHLSTIAQNNHLGYCPNIWYKYLRKVSLDDYQLSTKSITNYYDDGNITNKINYKYDNANYKYITSKTYTSSIGDQIKETYQYPYNKKGNLYQEMVNKNILAPLISYKKTNIKNGLESTINTVENIYKKWGNAPYLCYKPEMIKSSTRKNPLTTKIVFKNYSPSGKVTQVKKNNDNLISYIYYKDEYLMIRGENIALATLKSAAFTAAGCDLQSLWNFCMTGSNLSKWKDFNTKLRSDSRMSNALITTFLYKPLVGIMYKTDSQNNTITYTYDSFGRLQYEKNDDGHIINKYEYHLKTD